MELSLIDDLRATAELCGTNLSEIAAQILAEEVLKFPETQIRGALSKCRRELKGRLTLAEIISRLGDGRPGPDEAWAMLTWGEDATVVLTEEMTQAQGSAWSAYGAGDKVGARMAFKETYVRLVSEARERRVPVKWFASLGYDKAGREGPIKEAVQKCRIAPEEVAQLLGPSEAARILSSGIPQTQYLLQGEVSVPDFVKDLAKRKRLK